MSRENWAELVRRFADGRQVCNCGCAWLTNCGEAAIPNADGTLTHVYDYPCCKYGCSANQIDAREEIAGRILRGELRDTIAKGESE